MDIKSIVIDEEGYFVTHDGLRINDENLGREMLDAIQLDEYGVLSLQSQGVTAIVEAFDKPLVAKQVHLEDRSLFVQMPYQYRQKVDLNSLCLDEWDRFHGLTDRGIPFVLSRPAQAELFNLCSGFSDDSITIGDSTVQTPNYYFENNDLNLAPFWSEKYQTLESPPWNLEEPHPEIKSFLQQLKINKCRILVPGCGYGHDAALFAELGHVVTGVDVSHDAIEGAKKRYSHIKNLTFVADDVFNLDESHHHAYDMIFEHTLFCAISPRDRKNLSLAWRKYLDETGHLLGIFFVIPKRNGPYFGGSEWEVREVLQKRFQFLYWTRLKHSPGWRKGAELMVYAQLKN